MDGTDSKVLIQAGEFLLALKVFLTAMHWLWIYDYFLTLGDEITYAWSGMKSWIFILFIANRYTPVLYLTWVNVTMFNYTKSFCDRTKWISVFHIVAVTVPAQTAVALRIYAVTARNKLLGGLLFVLIFAQLCFGVYFITRTALSPLQPLPDVNVDAFKICIYNRWKLGELLFTNLVIGFDLLAFSIILVIARRTGTPRYPGIPNILDAILRDATVYFIFMFAFQIVLEMFLLFAPEEIQLMPGVVNVVFVPVMASRLMLSLKKAAAEPTELWSLETMSNAGRTRGWVGTIRFASQTFDVSQEISDTLALPNEEDMELEPIPRSPWSHQRSRLH